MNTSFKLTNHIIALERLNLVLKGNADGILTFFQQALENLPPVLYHKSKKDDIVEIVVPYFSSTFLNPQVQFYGLS